MDKEILRLQHGAETIKELLEKTQGETEKLREALKRLDGFAFGHKEIRSKFGGHVKQQQEELAKVAGEGKITPAVVSFVSAYLLASKKFIDDLEADARKLLHTRQGELLATINSSEGLATKLSEIEKVVRTLEESEVPEPATVSETKEPTPSAPEVAVTVTPENSEKTGDQKPTKNKRKNSRARPDEVGPLKETVKRLKEARSKRA